MTLGIATTAGFLGGWTTGCIVLLIGVWLFLALLGIRNGRFPWRVVGGGTFIVGSALWLGMHPAHASAWEVDAGYLGFAAESSLLQPGGSQVAQNLLAALLAACSVLGLLVAIDWLPLMPFAPLLGHVEARLVRAADARAAARAAAAAAARQQALATAIRPGSTAATMVLHSTATIDSPTLQATPAAPPLSLADAAAVVSAGVAIANVELDAVSSAEVADAIETENLEPRPTVTSLWDRFKPRASVSPEAPPDENAVDNEAGATDNSSLELGVSRAEAAPLTDAPTNLAIKSTTEPQAQIEASTPAADPEQKDSPVPDHDLEDEVTMPSDAESAVATIDGVPSPIADRDIADLDSAAASVAVPDVAVGETIAPRRKKKDDEPAESPPEEEPGEGDDKEGDDKEGDDKEGDDKEGDDELEEDEEEWEEDDDEKKKEGDEEKEEDEDEEWDDDEETDEPDDDESGGEEDDAKEGDDADDAEEDDEEADDGDDQSSSTDPVPQSIAAVSSSIEVAPLIEVAPSIEGAPAESVTADVPSTASAPIVEVVAIDTSSIELPLTDAPVIEVAAPVARAPVAPTQAPISRPPLPPTLFAELPADERELLGRATELLLRLESVSLSKLQRELAITYYSAARVFERLEKEGFVAPYTGSLARLVRITRTEWDARLRA
ncbi:MAG: hypothetical protein EXS13_08525 [Planctomycetes bacterium]|nr:hypothetical protein [Planctomycetota bacterium]